MKFREKVWKYRIVQKKRQEKKNMNGISPFKAKGKTAPIEITNWNSWKSSYWVCLRDYKDQMIILDSGVIEELASAIKRIKQGKEAPSE